MKMSLMKVSSIWLLPLVGWALGLGSPETGNAATIEVKHTALEKLLTDASQPGGRKFLSGREGDACGWSYVRSPRVETAGRRLKLSARLRGAFAFGGGCLKMQEELPVEVLGEPVYGNGILSLANPEIRVQGNLAGEVTSALLSNLLRLMRVPLQEKIVGLMAPSPDGVSFKLVEFDVNQLEVLSDRVRLTVSFGLEVH